MTGDITDYIGRSVDISLFQGVAAGRNNMLEMSLTGQRGGLIIAGAAKLAQRFFLELMTERGSIPSQPSRGSGFLFEARNGLLRTTAEVEQAFYLAEYLIRGNLLTEESDSMPDDERYGGAELISVNLSNLNLTLSVAVSSRTGDSREVILPVPMRAR